MCGLVGTARLFKSSNARFVDIGLYGHVKKEAVQAALRPWWRALLDGERVAHWRFFGGYSLLEGGKDLRAIDAFDDQVTSSVRMQHSERPYAQWQQALLRVAAEVADDRAPPVLVGQAPSTAWVYLGRLLSHNNERPIVVNQGPPTTNGSAPIQVFDFRVLGTWWLRAQYWIVERRFSSKRLLRTLETAPLLSHNDDAPKRSAIVLFVTPSANYRLADDEQRFVEETLRAENYVVRSVVDVRPSDAPLANIGQVHLHALTSELRTTMDALRQQHGDKDGTLGAVAVATTGPAPLAFALGSALRGTLDGDLLTFERKRTRDGYELAFDSRRDAVRK